jgi:cysteine desulfurase / selenocysteine lyase
METFDIDRARADTPGVMEGIFLDSAGSSLMPGQVLERVLAHLHLEARLGGYRARENTEAEVAAVYQTVARLLHCDSREVALLESATRAWDAAFYALRFRPGDRILTDVSVYGSNYLALLQTARRSGAEIVVVPDDEGQLDLDALDAAVDERTRLIAITWIPTGSGRVNPAAAVGAIARAHDVMCLLDACQAVGQLPIDVSELGCDFLTGTGRKYLRGPRGTGFLYVRDALIDELEPPVVDVRSADWVAREAYRLRSDARRFETWEMNFAAVLGLGSAIEYALRWDLEITWYRIKMLADRLRRRLEEIPGVSLHDTGKVRCGIVTFSIEGLRAAELKRKLADNDCTVSVSRVSSQRLDFETRGLEEVVRASVHYFNSADELDRFAATIERVRDG